MAERLGVSRAPVREALHLLEERRLIERHRYSGAKVTVFTAEDIASLYEAREVLEARACFKAALQATKEDLDELQSILAVEARQVSGEEAPFSGVKANADFHAKIIRIAGNREIERLLSNDFWRYSRIFYQIHWGRKAGRDRQRHLEHIRIFEAIRDGDGPLAELLMQRHIQSARSFIDQVRQQKYGRRASDKV